MAKKRAEKKAVATLKHGADRRKNIPTAELQPVVSPEAQRPVEVRYPRNRALDPQLMWRGKDEQDWNGGGGTSSVFYSSDEGSWTTGLWACEN